MSTSNYQLPTKLILASASPRRAEILRQIGLQFEIQVSNLNEEQYEQAVDPPKMVMDLAFKKAQIVAETITNGLVIGADTVVVIEGEILGKPSNQADAISMLSKLNGREHSVFTGVALIEVPGNHSKVLVEETRVIFCSLPLTEIEAYVATEEPLDKAGAYGIQGKGAVLIKEIHGCYFNVVGLPIRKLITMLKEFGVYIW